MYRIREVFRFSLSILARERSRIPQRSGVFIGCCVSFSHICLFAEVLKARHFAVLDSCYVCYFEDLMLFALIVNVGVCKSDLVSSL